MSHRYISTRSGGQFHFERPTTLMVDLFDIAAALSKICRFTGHCSRFYSVAEHSIHVSHIVPPEVALEGLLHDAAKAYVGDVAKPLKRFLPDYQAIESRVWEAVARKFELPEELDPAVKAADLAMLKREVAVLLPPNCAIELDLPGDEPDISLHCWHPEYAEYFFLQRFKELTGE